MAKLYFYYSAMNAGKSTVLLQSNHNYIERGMNTLLFTPKIDDRYQSGFIHSRIGLSAEALAFSAEDNLLVLVKSYREGLLACAPTLRGSYSKAASIYWLGRKS